ncbi:MAG: RDD family protein [Chloroflexi bacterium]|nr:RDD family protein [Chloroflexota bacterium]
MTSTSAAQGEPAATDQHRPRPGRWQRSAAVLIDVASAALAVLVATLFATLWLLARTAWGRDDAGSGDALLATSLVLAALPAWATWQLVRVRRGAGTVGQARLALAVTPAGRHPRSPRAAATIRFACHPLAVTAWLWLSVLTLLLGSELAALASLAAAAVWTLAGLISLAFVVHDPAARALHDRLAGTSLVRR